MDDSTTGTGTGQFNFTGTWLVGGGSGEYQGSDHYSNTANDSVIFTFSGTKVIYYGSQDPNNGTVAASIDGGAETPISAYAATRADQVALYASPTLPAGTHTLKLRVTGTAGAGGQAYISVDKADYFP